MNVSDEGRVPERFSGAFVSANVFRIIGQAPVIGRDFLPEDDRPGAAAVVMLGNGIWKNALRQRCRHRRADDPGQ